MENQDRVRALKDELKHALIRLGGMVWETPRLNNGAPTVHFVWDGQYYGFYPIPKNSGIGTNAFERKAMENIIKAGGIAAVVSSVAMMEDAMGLDISKRELARLLPTRKLKELLHKWGKGEKVDPSLEEAILRLQKDWVQVIYGVYFDRMTLNQFAAEYGIQYRAAQVRHCRALHALRESLVKKYNVVGDHVLD